MKLALSRMSSRDTHLQCVLPREALLAMIARERLDRQMDPLMPLQIVVAVEALRALVALERTIVGRRRLSMGRMVGWVPAI